MTAYEVCKGKIRDAATKQTASAHEVLAELASARAQLEQRDDWMAKQLDGLIEDAEAVAHTTGLALARSVVANLRDARKAVPAARTPDKPKPISAADADEWWDQVRPAARTPEGTTGHVHDWKCAPGCPREFRDGVVPPAARTPEDA